MYADRHARPFGRSSTIEPRSLGIAVAINGSLVAALLLAQPSFKIVDHVRSLRTYAVPIQPPPPLPKEPAQHPLKSQSHPLTAPRPQVDTHISTAPVQIDQPQPAPSSSVEVGPVIVPYVAPNPPLTLVPAEIDPAHRGDLQPTYPAGELRAEHEGVVTVRVLIGADGRVHQVEQVAATSDAFFRATQERALARWRFRPATRGGVPVEAWRTMTIRFVIPR
ncbi:energy transducer TonB [Sphingomonas bacterium]|uniref:energy transducer TonB n=1 Tax=Sphingomonas bacterium TaxID=1895847 RepID=UPI0015775C0D|nr:energy transducer TonB [Sphingomonas bacterium]